jgi:hypothetical protein
MIVDDHTDLHCFCREFRLQPCKSFLNCGTFCCCYFLFCYNHNWFLCDRYKAQELHILPLPALQLVPELNQIWPIRWGPFFIQIQTRGLCCNVRNMSIHSHDSMLFTDWHLNMTLLTAQFGYVSISQCCFVPMDF